MSNFIWSYAAIIAATVAIIAAHIAHRACSRADAALARASSRSSEAIQLASFAIERASLAIDRVSSSRESRLAEEVALSVSSFSSSQRIASNVPSSSIPGRDLPAAMNARTAGIPCLSNDSRNSAGVVIETPNVKLTGTL